MLPGKQPQPPFAVRQHFWSDLHLEQSQRFCANAAFAGNAVATAIAPKTRAKAGIISRRDIILPGVVPQSRGLSDVATDRTA
jgi:hypothetical protein